MLTSKKLQAKRNRKELKRKAKRAAIKTGKINNEKYVKRATLKARAMYIIQNNPTLLAKYNATNAVAEPQPIVVETNNDPML